MGRDDTIQEPYTPYHSMMDLVLSVLPSDPTIVRYVAFMTTAVAAVVMFLLIIELITEWQPNISRSDLWVIPPLVLLTSPEFFYFGLVYSPTMVAMAAILGAHLIIRQTSHFKPARDSGRDKMFYFISLIVFAIGAGFRWNTAAYALVILADFLVYGQNNRSFRSSLPIIIWMGLAPFATLIFIFASGYTFQDIFGSLEIAQDVTMQSGSRMNVGVTIDARTIGTLLPLITPAFVIFSFVGSIELARHNRKGIAIVGAGLLAALPWLATGIPKFIIVSIPGLVLCAFVGLSTLWHFSEKTNWNIAFRVILVGLIMGPWIIGVETEQRDVSWGPGFQLKPFNRDDEGASYLTFRIGAGTAMPTPEGIRPIGGHAFALLGGQWRDLHLDGQEELESLINAAIEQNLPIVKFSWSPDSVTNILIERGWTTEDKQERLWQANDFFRERRYALNDDIVVFYYGAIDGSTAITDEEVQEILTLLDVSNRVVIHGNPRTMWTLYQRAPDAFVALGKVSGILDLELLASAEATE
jgi:hypothetical protein